MNIDGQLSVDNV